MKKTMIKIGMVKLEDTLKMMMIKAKMMGVPPSVAWTLMGCATDVRNKVNSRHLWHTHPA